MLKEVGIEKSVFIMVVSEFFEETRESAEEEIGEDSVGAIGLGSSFLLFFLAIAPVGFDTCKKRGVKRNLE